MGSVANGCAAPSGFTVPDTMTMLNNLIMQTLAQPMLNQTAGGACATLGCQGNTPIASCPLPNTPMGLETESAVTVLYQMDFDQNGVVQPHELQNGLAVLTLQRDTVGAYDRYLQTVGYGPTSLTPMAQTLTYAVAIGQQLQGISQSLGNAPLSEMTLWQAASIDNNPADISVMDQQTLPWMMGPMLGSGSATMPSLLPMMAGSAAGPSQLAGGSSGFSFPPFIGPMVNPSPVFVPTASLFGF
ncbi:MAG: hypothetical protein SFZ03_06690 [Candidatus Melainabacteria bacterium]|nr:hypothetical protein [Candidatus Melainabacteria bacterium]